MPSMKMGADFDLAGFFLINLKPEPVATLPTAGASNNGRVVFLTSDGRFYIGYQNAWKPMGMDVQALEGLTPAQLRDRSTHSGTQAASTISDLATVVKAYKLSDFAPATADLALGSNKLTGVAPGTSSTDATNKAQLDAVEAIALAAASGIAVKKPCRVASTTNLTLSGTQTIDTVVLVAGDRVLVAGQTTQSANGIYVVAAGAWARSADADQDGELAPGTLVAVTEGATNGDTLWGLVSDAPITPGTTNQSWNKILSSTGEIIQAGNGIDKTGVIVSIKLTPSTSGLIVDGTGLRIDPAKVTTYAEGAVPAGTPPITITHNLGTEYPDIDIFEVATKKKVLVPYNSNGTPNSTQLEFGATSISAGQYYYKARK